MDSMHSVYAYKFVWKNVYNIHHAWTYWHNLLKEFLSQRKKFVTIQFSDKEGILQKEMWSNEKTPGE